MFENRSITFKLAFMVAIPLLFLLAINGGVFYLSSELEERKEISDTAHDMQINVINIWQWLTDISVTRAAKGLDDGFTKADENYKDFLSNLTKIQEHPLMKTKTNQLNIIKRNFEAFYICGKTMADGYIKTGTEKGNELMGEFDRSGQALKDTLDPFIEEQTKLVKQSLFRLHYGSAAVGLLAVLIGILLCWRTARTILLPIQRLTKSSAELASGDLTATVDIDTNDELGQLGRHFNLMARNLTEIVTKIRLSAAHVSQAANDTNSASHRSAESIEQESAAMESIAQQTSEISAQVTSVSSQVEQLSAGIEQASTTLESQFDFVNRTSATIEEMAASASSVADRANHAKMLSINSVKQADAGSKAVDKAISGMSEISTTVHEMSSVIEKLGRRSDQIGEILHTINTIAAQTNLLALNAAIEAARAGEHGRGFAVVADEVRKLAEGTAGATEEIADIVRGIQQEAQDAIHVTKLGKEKISEGTDLTQSVGKVLTTLIDSINNSSQAVEEIAAASEEQKSAAEEAAESVQELKGMSEQISIGVKEESRSINEISIATNETAKAVQGSASALQQIKTAIELSSQGVMELAASAEKLQEQSHELSELIDSFKVDDKIAEQILFSKKNSKGGGSKGLQQLSVKQDCWEYKKCGREKGGAKAGELGVCPAYPDKGKNCATVAGTFCGGQVQGAFASKIKNCTKCDYYNSDHYGGM